MYHVHHTTDELGGRYEGEGPITLRTDDLAEAVGEAERMTDAGQCGYVRRTSDGAILCPDGTWHNAKE